MSSAALIVPRPGMLALRPLLVAIAPLAVNRFPNKLAPKVSNRIPRTPPCCYFASFLILWLTPFMNKLDF